MSEVLTVRDGEVLVVTLNRPERMNALTDDVVHGIAAALDEAEATGARAVVLTGAGRGFCSGADLQAAGEQAEEKPDMGSRLESIINPTLLRMTKMSIPIVVALNGAAAGAGAGYALAADFIVAARSSYLLLPFITIGLVPDAGLTWFLPRLVGRQRAIEIMMLGERLNAEKAEAWGVIHKVVDDDTLMEEAMTLAHRLASTPPRAIGILKRNVALGLDSPIDVALQAERIGQREAGNTDDFQEGVRAFLEKRKPVFIGR